MVLNEGSHVQPSCQRGQHEIGQCARIGIQTMETVVRTFLIDLGYAVGGS